MIINEIACSYFDRAFHGTKGPQNKDGQNILGDKLSQYRLLDVLQSQKDYNDLYCKSGIERALNDNGNDALRVFDIHVQSVNNRSTSEYSYNSFDNDIRDIQGDSSELFSKIKFHTPVIYPFNTYDDKTGESRFWGATDLSVYKCGTCWMSLDIDDPNAYDLIKNDFDNFCKHFPNLIAIQKSFSGNAKLYLYIDKVPDDVPGKHNILGTEFITSQRSDDCDLDTLSELNGVILAYKYQITYCLYLAVLNEYIQQNNLEIQGFDLHNSFIYWGCGTCKIDELLVNDKCRSDEKYVYLYDEYKKKYPDCFKLEKENKSRNSVELVKNLNYIVDYDRIENSDKLNIRTESDFIKGWDKLKGHFKRGLFVANMIHALNYDYETCRRIIECDFADGETKNDSLAQLSHFSSHPEDIKKMYNEDVLKYIESRYMKKNYTEINLTGEDGNMYISDRYDEILSYCSEESSVYMIAGCGVGKTKFACKLFDDDRRKVLVCCHMLSIAGQCYKNYQDFKVDRAMINEWHRHGVLDSEISKRKNILCIWDTYDLLCEKLEDKSILLDFLKVFDESHNLIECDYRFSNIHHLLTNIMDNSIYMTATPAGDDVLLDRVNDIHINRLIINKPTNKRINLHYVVPDSVCGLDVSDRKSLQSIDRLKTISNLIFSLLDNKHFNFNAPEFMEDKISGKKKYDLICVVDNYIHEDLANYIGYDLCFISNRKRKNADDKRMIDVKSKKQRLKNEIERLYHENEHDEMVVHINDGDELFNVNRVNGITVLNRNEKTHVEKIIDKLTDWVYDKITSINLDEYYMYKVNNILKSYSQYIWLSKLFDIYWYIDMNDMTDMRLFVEEQRIVKPIWITTDWGLQGVEEQTPRENVAYVIPVDSTTVNDAIQFINRVRKCINNDIYLVLTDMSDMDNQSESVKESLRELCEIVNSHYNCYNGKYDARYEEIKMMYCTDQNKDMSNILNFPNHMLTDYNCDVMFSVIALNHIMFNRNRITTEKNKIAYLCDSIKNIYSDFHYEEYPFRYIVKDKTGGDLCINERNPAYTFIHNTEFLLGRDDCKYTRSDDGLEHRYDYNLFSIIWRTYYMVEEGKFYDEEKKKYSGVFSVYIPPVDRLMERLENMGEDWASIIEDGQIIKRKWDYRTVKYIYKVMEHYLKPCIKLCRMYEVRVNETTQNKYMEESYGEWSDKCDALLRNCIRLFSYIKSNNSPYIKWSSMHKWMEYRKALVQYNMLPKYIDKETYDLSYEAYRKALDFGECDFINDNYYLPLFNNADEFIKLSERGVIVDAHRKRKNKDKYSLKDDENVKFSDKKSAYEWLFQQGKIKCSFATFDRKNWKKYLLK